MIALITRSSNGWGHATGISPGCGEEGALPLKPRPDGCGSIIQAQPFCRYFRIKVDATERFDEPATDEHGILGLDLKRSRRVAQKRSAFDVAAVSTESGSDRGSQFRCHER